jgi:hypothetical protein
VVVGLLLAGCAHQPAARETTTRSSSSTAVGSPSHPPRTSSSRSEAGNANHDETATGAGLPEQTGIAACDDYLSSYIACHRAGAIYPPDQLQSRYEAMRTSLLRDSQNPEIRPQLAARCNSLANMLRQALHGKTCADVPAPSSSSP